MVRINGDNKFWTINFGHILILVTIMLSAAIAYGDLRATISGNARGLDDLTARVAIHERADRDTQQAITGKLEAIQAQLVALIGHRGKL